MVFRDMLLRCGACGKEFVYTVREQRQRQQQGLPTDPPAFCSDCRVADVRKPKGFAPGQVQLKRWDAVKVYPKGLDEPAGD